MIINYTQFGQLELEPSKNENGERDGRDTLFLQKFILNIPKNKRKELNGFLAVDMPNNYHREDGSLFSSAPIEDIILKTTEKEKNKPERITEYIEEEISRMIIDPNFWI